MPLVAVGSVGVSGGDVLAGVGTRNADATTEFTRKLSMRDSGDLTTILRRALDKAWKNAHSPKDLNTVYRGAAE